MASTLRFDNWEDGNGNTVLSSSDYRTPGLVFLSTTEFSSVPSFSLDDAFSSEYESYKIVLKRFSSDSVGIVPLSIRFRSNGSDDTSTNYQRQMWRLYGSQIAANTGNGSASGILISYISSGNTAGYSGDIISPYVASATQIHISSTAYQSDIATSIANIAHGYNSSSTQFDGFTIYPSSGNISGVVSIYGYAD